MKELSIILLSLLVNAFILGYMLHERLNKNRFKVKLLICFIFVLFEALIYLIVKYM